VVALVAAGAAPAAQARSGPSSAVHGRSRPAPDPIPVLAIELHAPMMGYRAYVRGLLGTLQVQLGTLRALLAAGDVAGAQSAWLAAHLSWLRIGQDDGAYGAFGDMGRQIDGTAAGLVDGTADPAFTGFHKVELDLWTRRNVGAATADAATLGRLVRQLASRPLADALPMNPTGLSTWTLRAHEILEDALRDSLSGDDEYGSGTALASVTADVAATREMLTLLAPALEPRAPHVVGRARRQLMAVGRALQATRVNGRWVPVAGLGSAQRERVDAAVGAVLETLAPIPDVLHVLGGS
jgi:iron uptake system EfeUOB component EfeO/EfeM